MNLYHYFETSNGPFRSISALPPERAEAVLNDIRAAGDVFASKRPDRYLDRRRHLERTARELFIRKGGKPVAEYPQYMVVEACRWLETWYGHPGHIVLPVSWFDPREISFSYGDLFPTFSDRVDDGKEYRKRIYTLEEIVGLIERYGLPQDWNGDGTKGPERYVEAQIWSDIAGWEANAIDPDGTGSEVKTGR